MNKSMLSTSVVGAVLAATGAAAPAAMAAPDTVSVSVPTVQLPRRHAPTREVVATVTVDREVRWSATVATRSYGGLDFVGTIREVRPRPGEDLLEPGANRVVIGTTAEFSDPGPQRVTVVTTDSASGAEVGRASATVKVVGQLREPRIRRVRLIGHRVVLHGTMASNVPDLRLTLMGHRLGKAGYTPRTMVTFRPIQGRWTARLRIGHATRLHVKATSAYGRAAVSRTVTIRP
jgi:hypothetical protein